VAAGALPWMTALAAEDFRDSVLWEAAEEMLLMDELRARRLGAASDAEPVATGVDESPLALPSDAALPNARPATAAPVPIPVPAPPDEVESRRAKTPGPPGADPDPATLPRSNPS